VTTRKPGDLPVAVVLRSAEVRRANGFSRETTIAVAALEGADRRSTPLCSLAVHSLAAVGEP